MKIKINMHECPKFWEHIQNDYYDSWEESLWANGFKSAHQEYGSHFCELNEQDYLMFLLKWS